jgi:hypothetical protein
MTRTSKIITAFAALGLASAIAATPASAAGSHHRSAAVAVGAASTMIDSTMPAAEGDAMSANGHFDYGYSYQSTNAFGPQHFDH